MIAFLKGKFVYKSPALIHIDVNGVGYEVHIGLNTYTSIQDKSEGILLTHLIVREDAHILYGFAEQAEKEMFLHLLSVSGVGASTARMMISYLKPEELSRAIVQGDTRTLENIKGIGKKSAERIVLELKDKLARNPVESNISPLKHNTLRADAFNALLALGIARNAADQAVEKALKANPESTSVEEIIKNALKSV